MYCSMANFLRAALKMSHCTNCGNPGHHIKNCTEPVTSQGLIAFRVHENSWDQARRIASDENDITGIPSQNVEFLLIQRRDSIGQIELLRAKQKLTDLEQIIEQIAGTTLKEREALLTKPFPDLWVGLWGPMNTVENRQQKQEQEQAKLKFEALTQGFEIGGQIISLEKLIETIPVLWKTPEWGFPKGRRNIQESDLKCATREFHEETGIAEQDLRLFENVEPIRENFFGNNKVHYCHVQYLAWVPRRIEVQMKKENELMTREVGGIGWFSLEKALELIRPTNVEKREVLLRASTLLRNLCPLFVGPVVSVAEQSHHSEVVTLNRNRGNESNPREQSHNGTDGNWTPVSNHRRERRISNGYAFIDEQ